MNLDPFRHVDLLGGVIKDISTCEDSKESLADSNFRYKLSVINAVLDSSGCDGLLRKLTYTPEMARETFYKWFSSDFVDMLGVLKKSLTGWFKCKFPLAKDIVQVVEINKIPIETVFCMFERYPINNYDVKQYGAELNGLASKLMAYVKTHDEFKRLLKLKFGMGYYQWRGVIWGHLKSLRDNDSGYKQFTGYYPPERKLFKLVRIILDKPDLSDDVADVDILIFCFQSSTSRINQAIQRILETPDA